MTAAEACLRLVDELPGRLVQSLIEQLRRDAAPVMPHPGYQARVDEFLRRCDGNGFDLASMLDVAVAAKRAAVATELVWTGPATAAIPARHTEQVLCDLIQDAAQRLTIMSFGIFQVPRLVTELEHALARDVEVRILLGDRESTSDQDVCRQRQQLGPVVAQRASFLQWPRERRSRDENGHAGLMHAKAAMADSRLAFLTSANLTEAALERNMEIGVLIRGGSLAASIDRLVDALLESGELHTF
jgi:phosphatidylserine/phosphatidylglycerophosphate/cardiolipin synthase-like enzyme